MTTFNKILIIAACLTLLINCTPRNKSAKDKWEILFDGSDLDNWDKYLGPEIKPGVSWENIHDLPHLGLNNDTARVFSIVELNGEKVLRISGEIGGGISTKQVFKNYHLQLQFKWGKLKWYPHDKDTDPRDSGLLYHGVGQHGDGDGFWYRSQEFQIEEGDCGDYWGVAGAISDIHAIKINDSTYRYDPDGALLTFRNDNKIGRHCVKYPDAENPSGEWNIIDLYCLGDTSIHAVNGTVNMVLLNSRIKTDNEISPLTSGRIELQSEGAEIYYRNIRIKSIDRLPDII